MKRYVAFSNPRISLLLSALLIASFASAAEEEDLALSYGDKDVVSIATGTRQPIARAPSVATVITAEDIRAMGATELDEILETVPGLHVARSNINYNPIYVIRGIYTALNPQVLLLLNGIPLTNVFVGDRGQGWGNFPVRNIQRIEVIRGPGSALYGADAFAGVINIVTKTTQDITGTEVGFGGGSFDTLEAWMLHGTKWGSVDAAVSLEVGKTRGFRETVESDAQSALDGLFGSSASLAPGPTQTGKKNLDLRLDLSLDSWRLRFGYRARRDIGTGAGAAQALDSAGGTDSDRFNLDLTHTALKLAKNFTLQTQFSFFDVATKSDLTLFPPNSFGGAFPEGVIGNPDVYERHARLSVVGQYEGFAQHKLRVGAGININDLYKVRESKNFSQNAIGLPVPLGAVVDVSDTAPFVRSEDRKVMYAFAQDEWQLKRDWTLTAGVRADRYSDVGTTINPRLALVWDTRYNLTSKLLFGRAFRAPSFQELYNLNNPVALGNPDLDPETIESVELAFAYRPATRLTTGLNLFRYRIKDLLRLVADPAPATSQTAQNTGKQHGYGLELEAGWQATDTVRVSGHAAWQRAVDENTDADPGNAPRRQAYLRVDWRFQPHWSLGSQIKWLSERHRVKADPREALAGYELVDVTLTREAQSGKGWEFALSVRNLFDRSATEPSPAPGLIADDLPLAGRALRAEARYRF